MTDFIDRSKPLIFAPLGKIVCLEYPRTDTNPFCIEYYGTHWENILSNFFNKQECVCQVDTDVGMTADAIRVTFKYDTPDDTIKEICNQAIQTIQKAAQPSFKIGQTVLFQTTQSDLIKHNNSFVTIQRLLSDEECDIDDVGYMYEVKTENGDVFQAFEDELS